jgi:hypothetical protein
MQGIAWHRNAAHSIAAQRKALHRKAMHRSATHHLFILLPSLQGRNRSR